MNEIKFFRCRSNKKVTSWIGDPGHGGNKGVLTKPLRLLSAGDGWTIALELAKTP